MDAFSPDTLQCLTRAGWRPERRKPAFQHQARLIGEGYAWFSQVESFLAEFGGLAITFTRNGYSERLNFDAYQASDGLDRAWITNSYAGRIGQQNFCVIGSVYTDHLILFMDDSGAVYGCFDDYLCFVGSTGSGAIEVICSGKPVREIA